MKKLLKLKQIINHINLRSNDLDGRCANRLTNESVRRFNILDSIMDTNKTLKGISRIDSASTLGWYVRVYRNKQTYARFISDNKFGGKNGALKEALLQRDCLQKEIQQIPKKASKRRSVRHDKRNKTGVLGVTRASKKAKNGRSYECYTVTWRPEPKVQKSRSFSVKKYGEKRALELAIEVRKSVDAQ